MTTSFDPDLDLDRRLDAWFADGPTTAPDPILDGLPRRLAGQRQRPEWLVGRDRLPVATMPVRLLAAAAALVAVVVGASLLGGGGGIGPGPSPTPSASPTPMPTPLILAAPMASLAPGTYAFINNGGRTTFTVPDGWSVPTLGGLDFSLAPVDAAPDDTIRVFYDMRIAAKDAACSERPEDGLAATAAAIVGDIAANPGVDATSPQAITIGGLDGLVVDVALADAYTTTCPFTDGQPAVSLVVDTVPGEGPFWGVGPGERERIIVLDHPTATNVVVVIDSADGTTFDALVAAAMPVLETLTFE